MKKTYWEEHGKTGSYQMGDNPIRSYILDIIKTLNVENVLDVGCGSGPIYDLIKQKGINVEYFGSDYSSTFIDHCEKTFPETKWMVDDMRTLVNFEDRVFDCVLAFHSLDHIDKWMDALDAMYRVSKKYVIIVLWRPFSQGKINTSHHANYEDSHLTEFNKEELDEYIKNIGFEIIEEDEKYHGKQYNYLYVLKKK